MDPNWLSAVSLLGTCGGNGVRVRSYRLPSEFYFLNMLRSSMFIPITSESTDRACGGWLEAVGL